MEIPREDFEQARARPLSCSSDSAEQIEKDLWVKSQSKDGKIIYCRYALREISFVPPNNASNILSIPPSSPSSKVPGKSPKRENRPDCSQAANVSSSVSLIEKSEKPIPDTAQNGKILIEKRPWKTRRTASQKEGYHRKPATQVPEKVIELSSDEDDPAAPHKEIKRKRPLQHNTCKVCQRYWRCEDRRQEGQLKEMDVPKCKIHGHKKRPPNTPPNFWKLAQLTPPKFHEDSP